MRVDYLVVGAGIAGSVLARQLLEMGKRVMVIDEPSLSNSSKVAGGLYNPITGRKMVKTWNGDVLFEYLDGFYREWENDLDESFFYSIPIYRPFFSIEEQNEWMAKSIEPAYIPYIAGINQKPFCEDEVQNPYGGILLNKSGYLDTATLLKSFRAYLVKSGLLLESQFNPNKLQKMGGNYTYEGIDFRHLVFCDGHLSTTNPWFSWLPYRPVKGELLFIKSSVMPRVIYNRGVFVIPLGSGMCKCGSTYDHGQLDEIPTIAAKSELIDRVKSLVNFDFEVIAQKAGIRPATKDRKPFVGRHFEERNVWIFNGLGAKGVSLAPYYARQLALHMEENGALDDEVNIERFFSLF